MRNVLGGLCLLVAIAFGAAQSFNLGGVAWSVGLDLDRVLAFFGLLGPMLAAGYGAIALFESKGLQKATGWSGVVLSVAWAAALLVLLLGVAGVGRQPKVEGFDLFLTILGFTSQLLTWGIAGFSTLLED